MIERRIEMSLTAFRSRSRPQIYTDETQIVYRRTRICPRNTQPSHTTAGRHGRRGKLNPSSSYFFRVVSYVSWAAFLSLIAPTTEALIADLKLALSPTRSLLTSQFYLLCRFSEKLHSTSRFGPSISLAFQRLHSLAVTLCGFTFYLADPISSIHR